MVPSRLSNHKILHGFLLLLIVTVGLPAQVLGQKELFVHTAYELTQTDGNHTATISGRVFEADNRSVPNATVSLTINFYPSWLEICTGQLTNHITTKYLLLTDANGVFQISVQLPMLGRSGHGWKGVLYSLEVMKMGYKTVPLEAEINGCAFVLAARPNTTEFTILFLVAAAGSVLLVSILAWKCHRKAFAER